MGIRENIESIRAELEQELQRLDDVKQLEEARQRVLGKKGSLTALLRSMGQLSPEERPAAGQMINAGREKISAMLDELRQNNQLSAQDAMLVLKDILYHVYKGEMR